MILSVSYTSETEKAADSCVSGFFVSINIRIDYPKLSYMMLSGSTPSESR